MCPNLSEVHTLSNKNKKRTVVVKATAKRKQKSQKSFTQDIPGKLPKAWMRLLSGVLLRPLLRTEPTLTAAER